MLGMCLVTRVFLQANSCSISKIKRVRHKHVKHVNQRRKEENIVHNTRSILYWQKVWIFLLFPNLPAIFCFTLCCRECMALL
jgi:hypothetical protein